MNTRIITLAALLMFFSLQAQAALITVPVAAGSDDAEERLLDGLMLLNSSDLEFGVEFNGNSGSNQLVGMRFLSLNIPNGANIISATIRFTTREADKTPDPASYSIVGELSDNALTYSLTGSDISNRNATTSLVPWNTVPTWPTVGASGADQTTPDLSSIIQEIVNQPGWTSGNALALMIQQTTANSNRTARSFENGSGGAPVLIIDFGVAVPEPSTAMLLVLGLVGFATRRRRNGTRA